MASKAEPNVVPLCDVLLVLLIIFMVITPMVQRGIDIKLPETTADSGAQPIGLIVCTLLQDGKVDINRTVYEFDQAGDYLKQLYAGRHDKTIFIRAYASVPYGRVVELIDLARGAGVDTTGLVPEYIEDEN